MLFFSFLHIVVWIMLSKHLALLQLGTQHLDLNFRGINYYAEVYLNGHKKDLPRGMFRRHSLDVTDIVRNGENLLAVVVYPPDHPGSIPPEGGQGGDHEVHI